MVDSNLLRTLVLVNSFVVEEVHYLIPIISYIHLKSMESLGNFGPTSEFVLLLICDRVGRAELDNDDYSTRQE